MDFALGILAGLIIWFAVACVAAFIACRTMWR